MKSILSFLALSCAFMPSAFSQNALDVVGLTSASPSSVAYSLRKLSTAYTGPALKVRRSSDNAEANIAFDVSGTLTSGSSATFTAGVSVGSTLGTSQSGTISTDVSKTGTISIKPNKTGVINILNSSQTVTGTGTNFTTELVVGDRLFNASNNVLIGVVASITTNTTLVLGSNATTSSNLINFKTTNAEVTGTSTNFTGELLVGDRLFSMGNVYLGTVAAIAGTTSMTLNAVDAVAASAINYKGTSATVVGSGTMFTALSAGDLLVSNNTTLGIIASITNATSLTLTTKAGAAVTGLAFKTTSGTLPFSTFYSGTSAFVTTWYDQSGNGRNAIQLKPGNQAAIVNSGVLYSQNGKTSIQFSNSLASFLQTATAASYLNNSLYTLNNVTAEASISTGNQFPQSTTGGNGPQDGIMHFGYRGSNIYTLAQYGHDQVYNATPSTSLEVHTGVKQSISAFQFYKNGISLGVTSLGIPAYLSNVGLLSIGLFTPLTRYYEGAVSEIIVFPSALTSANIGLLNNNQLAFYSIPDANYWTGSISTNWNDTGNWSAGVIPTLTTPAIVVIPAGKSRYPLINTSGAANSIAIEAGASLTITGTLQLAGSLTNVGTLTATAGTVEMVGAALQTLPGSLFSGSTVQNVVINNSGGVSLLGNVTVSGNLTFTSGKLSLGAFALTLGGTVTNTVAGGLKGEANSTIIVNSTVNPTLSFDQTSPGGSNVLKNLTINSSGQVVNLSTNLIVNGTTTFTAGKLAIGANTLTLKGPIVNTVNEGLTGGLSSNLIANGSSNATLSLDQSVPGVSNALDSLTINVGAQTITLNKPIKINSVLAIASGTLADGGNQLTSTGIINLSTGTFKLGSASVATSWPGFGVRNILAGGTVEYAAGVSQSVSAVPAYQNLTISAAAGAVSAGNLQVKGILNLSAANPSSTKGCLTMGTDTLKMGALATTVGQGDVTGIVIRTTVVAGVTYTMGNEFTSITFPNTGTLPTVIGIKISIGTAPLWRTRAIKRSYDFIQSGGTGTKAIINSHYLDAELNGNIENKLVDFSKRFTGPVLTEHGKSNFNTIQNWVGLSNVNVAFFSSVFGDLELTLDSSTLTSLTWNGSTSTSWITATNWTPNGGPSTNTNLIIPDATTTTYDPSLPATASNGSVTIESGGILNADPGALLSLNNTGLAWSNIGGTFNPGSSTVTFTDANATMNGVTNFNNVVISTGAGLLMTTGSIMRIAGTMTNNGTFRPGILDNTVEYNGTSQTIIVPNSSSNAYHHLIISGSGTSVLPASSLNILGDLTINGAITTTGNTITMNGATMQTITGTAPLTLNNLTINNTVAPVSLGQNLTVGNTLTLTAGKLAIGSNTLTLSGNVVNTVPNGLTGSLTSNVVVNGAVSPVLSFDNTTIGTSNALNNLTINSTAQKPLLGSDLEVNGTLTFTAGKLALNGRTLAIKGAVVNTVAAGISGSSISNVIVSGVQSPTLSFDQSVAASTNQLNNFSVNSPAQEVFLGNPLIVGGSLGLLAGNINTTTANSLTLSTTASVTGGSDSSFIDGPLVRNTNSIAASIFPIGKTSLYHPISVTPALATAGVYNAEYFPTAAPAGTYVAGLVGIASDEYWNINKVSGPNAQVTLNYRADNTWSTGGPTSTDKIFVAHLAGGNWDRVSSSSVPGNTASGLYPLTSNVMASFSPFTFGFGSANALPLTLLSFAAAIDNRTVKLTWTTTREFSIATFGIERSSDGLNFNDIGALPASNTMSAKTYNWVDDAPLPGLNFYRLKMNEIDGSFTYSAIRKIDLSMDKGISIFPNPVVDHKLQISLNNQDEGSYTLNIYGINGQKVMSSVIIHDGKNALKTIDLGLEHSGMLYIEIVRPDNTKESFKVLAN